MVVKQNIIDVEQPQLYEKWFDYSKVPLIEFEDRHVAMHRPEKIWITDTTFRDGQQARPPYEVDHVVKLFSFLGKLSGKNGVIRTSEFFLYSARDRKAVEKCMELNLPFPIITSWIRAVEEDFKLVKSIGLKETGILTSVSDYHIFLKLKSTRTKVAEKYLRIIDAALEEGIIPRCHFEDITRADFHGFVIPFAQMLMERSKQAGIPIKIRACDTMGYGIPYANAVLPRSIPKIFEALHLEAGVPHENLEWHGHNDFHKGLINGTTAWLYHCSAVNGTLLGWGERTGNTPIEGLIMDYIALNGGDPDLLGIDTQFITRIGKFYHDELGDHIPENYPFIGKYFNTTRAGIHADGAIKDERIYNIFDTGKLLNRPLTVSITDKSGTAGIAFWINSYFSLEGTERIDKTHPGVQKIYNWVLTEYEGDRMSSISTVELEQQTKIYLPELFHSDLDGLKRRGQKAALSLLENLVDNNPEIRDLDIRAIEPILKGFMESGTFAKLIYVVDTNGNMLTDFICHPEDYEKYKEKLDLVNFSDRDWFLQAMETRKTYVSEFYVSRIVDQLCITVSKPIINNENEIIGILGLDVNFDNLIKWA